MSHEIKLLVSTSWKPERRIFLQALGISSGGLGEQLFGTVYDAIFVRSIEAKIEYNKYYSLEYKNISEYIYIRYGEKVTEEDLQNDKIYLVKRLPDVIDVNYDENKLNSVLKCIDRLGK